jgi:ADP-L-glycero-D-manno-heptose 6-epimerase
MIVVTGATGFIGSALVWDLNRRGYKDLLLSDHVSPQDRPGPLSKRQYGDFVPAKELLNHLKTSGQKVSCIFHMGACSSTTESDEDYLRVNNTEYSAHLFDFCRDQDVHYIYASSAATYGDGKMSFDDRTDPRQLHPLNPYGWSKLRFDIWALDQHPQPSNWQGLRFFNVYGPNEYHKGGMASVAYKAFNQIKETGKLKLFRSHDPNYEDGKQLRDFVYVKDVTNWMIDIMESKGAIRNGIYNMGYGQARTWLDLAHAVFKAMGKTPNIDWIDIPANIRDQYQYFTEAKMEKLMREGLKSPEWSLEAGVDDYIASYLGWEDPYL